MANSLKRPRQEDEVAPQALPRFLLKRSLTKVLPQLQQFARRGSLPGVGITLMPHQTEAVAHLFNPLLKAGAAFNITQTGGGKTAMSLFIANALVHRGCPVVRHVIVLCPGSMEPSWQKHLEANLCLRDDTFSCRVVRYPQLTAADSGGLFDARDPAADPGAPRTPSPHFRLMAAEGMLLIADECHTLKNSDSQCWKAFAALRAAMDAANSAHCASADTVPACAVLMLSATPFDKPKHIVALLNAAVVPSASTDTKKFTLQPLGLRKSTVEAFSALHGVVNGGKRPWMLARGCVGLASVLLSENIEDAYAEFWSSAGKEFFSAAAAAASAAKHRPAVVNLSFPLRGSQGAAFQSALRGLLPRAAGEACAPFALGATMDALEAAKAPAFAAAATSLLDANPNTKCVVILQHRAAMAAVAVALARFGVVTVKGEDTPATRASSLADFNKPDATFRVAVLSLGTCAAGVELDDKHGQWPRALLLSPSFHAADMQQALGRVARVDTASPPFVAVVYCSADAEADAADGHFPEVPLLRNISEKGCVMRTTTAAEPDGDTGASYLDQLPFARASCPAVGDPEPLHARFPDFPGLCALQAHIVPAPLAVAPPPAAVELPPAVAVPEAPLLPEALSTEDFFLLALAY